MAAVVAQRTVVHQVELEHLLGVAVTGGVEAVFQLFGGNERIIAGIDHQTQGSLRGGIVALPEEGLALDGVRETLGDTDGAVLVARTLTVRQVRHRFVAVLDDEIEDGGLGFGVAGLLGRIDHVVHDRRGAPSHAQVQVAEGAQDLGLGHDLLRGRGLAAFRQAVLEVVDRQVRRIHDLVEAAVGGADQAVVGRIAERVQLVLRRVVGTVVTAGIHVVAHVVPQGEDEVIVPAGLHEVGLHGLIDGDEGHFGIRIRQVEIIQRDHALLGDIQAILVASRQEETAKGKKNQYLFHNVRV